jgi:uncharacterized protein (TIGR04255 family)
MSRKIQHAPVYFAIVQVRFNPILALDTYAPSIQERLRKLGFPDAQRGVLATMSFNVTGPADGSVPQVPVAQTTRYTFCNMNRTAGFILDQGALSYQTTEYDVFESFSGDFHKGLQAVHDVVELAYTDRVGFRYLDAVYPKEGELLVDYLDPSVVGLVNKFEDAAVHSFNETNLQSRGLNVLARVIIQRGEVGFPPDLLANILPIANRFRALRGRHAILDTDGSVERRETFDLNRIDEHLRAIHDEIATVFRATVTPKALAAWE